MADGSPLFGRTETKVADAFSSSALNRKFIQRHPPSWLFKYCMLVQRSFKSYTRDLGNVLARLGITIIVALIVGVVCEDLGTKKNGAMLHDIFCK